LIKEDWDVFLTLNFRKNLPFTTGLEMIDKWDGLVSKQMVGRRYNLSKNFYRRMSFVGGGGYNGKEQLHFHLLVKLPPEWRTETNLKEFRRLVEFYFPRVGGKEVDFQTIGKTEDDRRKVVVYVTEPRHFPVSNESHRDNDSHRRSGVVVSRNFGMKF